MVTLRAPDSCGRPNRSASNAGMTLIWLSVASAPQITRSYSSCCRAAASTELICTASEPWIASSETCTALSAPMDSALRLASVAVSGPTVRTVTSPPWASLMVSASSVAYSSISLITLSAEARATVLSAGSSFRSLPESGTCLTRTTMFIALTFLRTRSGCGHGPAELRSWRLLAGRAGAPRGAGDDRHPSRSGGVNPLPRRGETVQRGDVRRQVQSLCRHPLVGVVGVGVALAAVAQEGDDAARPPGRQHLRHELERTPEIGARRPAGPPPGGAFELPHRGQRGGVGDADHPVDDRRHEGRLDPGTPDALDPGGPSGGRGRVAIAPPGEERRPLRVDEGQPGGQSAVPEVAADRGAGPSRPRPDHDPLGQRVPLQRELAEDGLRDVVVAPPVGGAFGVAELVEVVAAALGREPSGLVVDVGRPVHEGAPAAVELDQRDLLRAGRGGHHRDERQPEHPGEVGLADGGRPAGRLHDRAALGDLAGAQPVEEEGAGQPVLEAPGRVGGLVLQVEIDAPLRRQWIDQQVGVRAAAGVRLDGRHRTVDPGPARRVRAVEVGEGDARAVRGCHSSPSGSTGTTRTGRSAGVTVTAVPGTRWPLVALATSTRTSTPSGRATSIRVEAPENVRVTTRACPAGSAVTTSDSGRTSATIRPERGAAPATARRTPSTWTTPSASSAGSGFMVPTNSATNAVAGRSYSSSGVAT